MSGPWLAGWSCCHGLLTLTIVDALPCVLAEESAWVVVDGGVYDVTEFLEDVSVRGKDVRGGRCMGALRMGSGVLRRKSSVSCRARRYCGACWDTTACDNALT